MIVTGGLNVYAKEVELCIAAHEAIADAAVAGVPDDEFGEAVLAFVELEPGVHLSADEVIAHCRRHIAGYKKPKHVSFVATLPRTASGKVRKHILRDDWLAETQTPERNRDL